MLVACDDATPKAYANALNGFRVDGRRWYGRPPMRSIAWCAIAAVGIAAALACGPSTVEPEGTDASPTGEGTAGLTTSASTTSGIADTTESTPDVASPNPGPPALECENPEFRCSTPISPTNSHGGLGYIDARGCLRPRCDWTDDCGDDEVCIMGEAFGECVASVSGCDEVDGICSCLAGGVCNSAYCAAVAELPFELVDLVEGPSGHVRWVGGCSPRGVPTTTLTFGLDEPSCTSLSSGRSLDIAFPGTVPDHRDIMDERVFGEHIDFPWVESSFDANGNGISDDGPIAGGVIRLFGTNSGRYELVHGGLLVYGQFSEMTACPLQTPCE